jgi:PAS domain S-box-containing protein
VAEVVLYADDQGRYVDASASALDLLGYSLEELRMLSIWDLTPASQELDGLQAWQAFIRSGRLEGEYELMTKAGRRLMVRFVAVTDRESGRHR